MSAGKKGTVRWSKEQYDAFLKRTGQSAERLKAERSPAAGEEPKIKKRRGKMNKTEGRMADILEARRRRGEIFRYRFEGMMLRWGNEELFTFTPDFTVEVPYFQEGEIRPFLEETVNDPAVPRKLRFIEVKGAHIRERQWLQFKACRDAHPQYEFELWQWKGGTWTRLA